MGFQLSLLLMFMVITLVEPVTSKQIQLKCEGYQEEDPTYSLKVDEPHEFVARGLEGEGLPSYCVCSAPNYVTQRPQPSLYVVDRYGRAVMRKAVKLQLVGEQLVRHVDNMAPPEEYNDEWMRYVKDNGDEVEDFAELMVDLKKEMPTSSIYMLPDKVWEGTVRTSYCSGHEKNGHHWPIEFDETTGHPIKPGGDVGINGIGVNRRLLTLHAVDAIITRMVEIVSFVGHENCPILETLDDGYLVELKEFKGGKWGKRKHKVLHGEIISIIKVLQVLAIVRGDRKITSFPGGFIDPGQSPIDALWREFAEEVLDSKNYTLSDKEIKELQNYFTDCKVIYVGNGDDPRDTNWAWMETMMFICTKPLPDFAAKNLKGGDDALADSVEWITVQPEMTKFYAAHTHGVMLAGQLYGLRVTPSWFKEEKSMELSEPTALVYATKALAMAELVVDRQARENDEERKAIAEAAKEMMAEAVKEAEAEVKLAEAAQTEELKGGAQAQEVAATERLQQIRTLEAKFKTILP